jgi:seryl-tRNA synthetase
MHDIRAIRENPEAFAAALERRGNLDVGTLVISLRKTDEELRALLTDLQQKQARRNEASKLIGQAKAKKDEAGAAALMAEVLGLKDSIQQGEQKQRDLEAELRNQLAVIPNVPADDVPVGGDENANVEVAARAFVGKPRTNLTKDHVELGEALGMMDFERATRISGSRFFYLKGPIARLERALAAYMLDIHTSRFGYEEMVVPFLVRDNAMFGTGQLPKFEDDLFQTFKAEERDVRYWLVPTSEVPLTNYVHGEILEEAQLPLRMTAYTPCFRAEAGAAGRDTRGMIRTHQFSKVELVSITAPEKSNEEHERMTDAAQAVLKGLDLPHRVVTLCTGDMGFAARKTYDIEVWLPAQAKYREISSCSNCGDFQARRMNTRYRGADSKMKGPVHTLNGSGVAFSRLIPGIMENYQNPDGSIAVPGVLKPYMGGLERIEKA